MDQLADLLPTAGPAEPLRKGAWLDDPQLLRFVTRGGVDVFLQQRGPDGAGVGARHHLHRAKAGQLVLGAHLDDAIPGWGLVAVPLPDTRVQEADAQWATAQFASDDTASALLRAIEDWVTSTVRELSRPEPPRRAIALARRARADLDDGASVSPADRVVWAAIQEGNGLWLDRPDCVVNRHSGPCPLTRELYLLAKGPAAVEALDPVQLGRSGKLWDALALHLSFTVRLALQAAETAAQVETQRLEERASSSVTLTRNALTRLMSVAKGTQAPSEQQTREQRLLAALALVGKRIGVTFQEPPASDREAFERDPVITVCAASDVRFRSVALKEEWWTTDNGPLLATVGDSKDWVALLPVQGRRYELVDPETGTSTPVDEAVAATLGSFGYTFYRPFPDAPQSAVDLVLFGARGLLPDVAWIIAISMLAAGLGMLTPIVSGMMIDTFIPSADVPAIWQIVAALVGAAVATAMFELARAIGMLRIESKMDNVVQAAVWDRVLKLPTTFFRNFTAGDLATRINGINTIRHSLSGTTVHTILASVFSSFNFLLLFYYSAKLALVAACIVLIAMAVTLTLGYVKLRYERQVSEASGRLSGTTFQYLRGIAKLRVASAESRAFANWAALFTRQRELSFRTQHIANIQHTFFSGYQVLATGALFAAMGMLVMKDESAKMSTGDFIAFNTAFGAFFGAMVQLVETTMGLLNLVPIYERAKPILHSLPEVNDAKVHPGELQGAIEVVQLNFGYAAAAPILYDVSFSIPSGGYVALVGPSGSGKSTLFRLLLGFETPSTGTIYYDDQDIKFLDVNALRRQLGVVLQSGQLMAGDIFTNIVGASNQSIDDAWEAARMVGLEDDIKRMPMGMHTVISEGASTLSGGQRQRILIARAIVHRPRILFFDEATSALDNHTQAIVTSSLDQLRATRIVIAHRLSTVVKADRILVLQDGRIVQDGTYEQLVGLKGPFQELARRQLA